MSNHVNSLITEIDVSNPPKRKIFVGHIGETGFRKIVFLVDSWKEEFPTGTPTLVFKRADGKTYPVNLSQNDNGNPVFTPSSTETAFAGDCVIQLRWTQNEVLGKTCNLPASVESAIGSVGPLPDDDVRDYEAEISANTNARHTHSNKNILDGITAQKVSMWDEGGNVDKAAIIANTNARHTHNNKNVLDGITAQKVSKWDEGGTVDSELSSASTNPVQNKVVKAALDAKADASALSAKQDALTAGQNITISGNTISADVDPTEIASNVTDWLDANVDPVGSAVVVDSSLSVEGAAADAKAVGDAIDSINSELYGGSGSQTAYISESELLNRAYSYTNQKCAKPVVGEQLNTVQASATLLYFDVSHARSVGFPHGNSSEGNGNAFVDANGVVVEALVYTTGESGSLETANVPANAKYFVVSWWDSFNNRNLGIYIYGQSGSGGGLVGRVEALENQQIETDATLSISGAAADAKATGDEIAKVRSEIASLDVDESIPSVVEPTGNVSGYINTSGTIVTASATKMFYVPATPGAKYMLETSAATGTDSDKVHFIAEFSDVPAVGSASTNFERVNGVPAEPLEITASSNAAYIGFGHGTWMTDEQLTLLEIQADTVGGRIRALEASDSEIRTTLYGGYSGGESGEDVYIADDNFSRYASQTRENSAAKPVVGQSINIVPSVNSDVYYFPVSGVQSVTFPKANSSEGNGNAFVDSNGTVLKAFVYTGVTSREYTTEQVPTGATHFVITWWKSWATDYDLGIYLNGGSGGIVEGLVDRVEALEAESGAFVSALYNVQPVPRSTVNAMLKCAYTYIDACRSGALVYGDGTGTSQRAGTICCSTFMRQLLQGIPYNDYLPARADGTTKSGQRWRYGYRMLGDDYFEHDSTYTALQMYNKYRSDGHAFPCDFNMVGAEPGDLIVFGANVSSIRHIGMFVFRDVMGNAYIMDSNISARNGNLAIRIHKAYDHTLADSNNPVGIIRPNLSEVYFEPSFETAQISDSAWSFSGENGFGYFVDLDYSVTANALVTLNSENTFTPNYSGKDHRVLLIPATADGTLSGTFSGISGVVGKVSKFII